MIIPVQRPEDMLRSRQTACPRVSLRRSSSPGIDAHRAHILRTEQRVSDIPYQSIAISDPTAIHCTAITAAGRSHSKYWTFSSLRWQTVMESPGGNASSRRDKKRSSRRCESHIRRFMRGTSEGTIWWRSRAGGLQESMRTRRRRHKA